MTAELNRQTRNSEHDKSLYLLTAVNTWTIIAGERSWRAAQMAGLATIDCYFHEGNLSPPEILEEQIIENLQRRPLQPLEEAPSLRRSD